MKKGKFLRHFKLIFINLSLFKLLILTQTTLAQSLPNVKNLDIQPFKAQIKRLIQAKDFLGEPFTEATKSRIELAFNLKNEAEAIFKCNKSLIFNAL